MSDPNLLMVREELIKRLTAQYSHQSISIRSIVEIIITVMEEADPNLHLRVLDKLLKDKQ